MPPKRRSQTASGSSSARATKKARPVPSSPTSSSSSSSSHELPESTILKPYDISKVYRLLEPGPVLLVTTASKSQMASSKSESKTEHNVMTMGFHMVVQHSDPPLLACCIGPWDHSFKALQETKECVLCIPGADLVEQVVDIGNLSSSEVDKFAKFNLTKTRASELTFGAPLVEECLASIECRVHDRSMVKRYNMWVLEVVGAWTNGAREEKRTMHHKGIGDFVLDGEEVDLRERMVKWKEFQDEDDDEDDGDET